MYISSLSLSLSMYIYIYICKYSVHRYTDMLLSYTSSLTVFLSCLSPSTVTHLLFVFILRRSETLCTKRTHKMH